MKKINFLTAFKKNFELLFSIKLIHDKNEIKSNFKHNWYFPISAMAFFCLYLTLNMGYLLSLFLTFGLITLISTQVQSFWAIAKNKNRTIQLLAIITAIGICLASQEYFYANWSVSSKVKALAVMLPVKLDIALIIGIVSAVTAIFFVYFWTLLFWDSIEKIWKESKIFHEIKKIEWLLYSILFIIILGYMTFCFIQSQAFYATKYSYDIIYTSDSPSLVKGNVYLTLTHAENDLRQPLFAVFSAPFISIPYLIARLIEASATTQAIMINSVQILILFASNLILAKMLKLNLIKRICFILLTFCTYTQILFTLMMEQYIIAYFWLILCMYFIAEKKKTNRFALWGAGGTLLTSMILLPFMSTKSPIKQFKDWFMDMVKYGLEFVVLLLVFCRFDVIFNLTNKITQLSNFTGKSVTFTEKIYQYTTFITNCFVAPNACANATMTEYISWQLNPATEISFIGVLILVFVIISAIWNRKEKSSLLAIGWVGFSVIMLLGLGWGTKENGLILYSLYFGWAFFVLLFQFVEKIEKNLNVKYIIPIFTMVTMVILLMHNIPEIIKMVNFAITYYPV